MAYTDGDSLGVRIRIAFGASIAADPATWVWTDVTAWWYIDDDVTIGWGRSSGAEQPETSTFSATLKNTDGRFTAYDPRSPYWPHVRKWTPISYDIDLGDGVGWRNRFSGFIRKLPLTWPGASPFMALAKIEAVGVLGRLGRGKPPAHSAMRRTLAASGVVAYWPVEDGVSAGQAASAIAGHSPLTVSGTVEFKTVDDLQYNTTTTRYGTSALADLSTGGSMFAPLPNSVAAATSTAWTVHTVAKAVSTTLSANLVLLEWTTPGGTYVRWQLVLTTATHTQVIAYTAAGASTVVVDRAGVPTAFTTWAVTAQQVGGTINVTYWLTQPTIPLTGSVAGTLAGVTSLAVNPTGATATIATPVGHLAVWPTTSVPYPTEVAADSYGGFVFDALRSHLGEAATDRLVRLAAEDGSTLTMPALTDENSVTRMGWQTAGAPLDLYRQCEDADQGVLYESGFGLGYLPRVNRYNAPVTLTIDAAAGQLGMPFEPVDDDQGLRNLWTVERTGGSSAVAADQESIDLQGEIEGSATVNLATDGPLQDHAEHRLRQSTVQEPRYPAVGINLAAHPELAAAWCACKPGSRINVVNPPEQNVPGTVDQLVVGATETYRGRRSWKATLNVVPASPWQVATVDGEQLVPADGSTLAADLTGAAPAVAVWDFTAGSGVLSWTAIGGTVAISGGALLFTPNGVTGSVEARSPNTPVVAGSRYATTVTATCAVTRTVTPILIWRNAVGTLLSSSSGAPVSVTANVPAAFAVSADAPVGATQAQVSLVMGGTPPATNTLSVDVAQLAEQHTIQLASTAGNGVWTIDPADFPLDIRVGGERMTLSAISGTTSPQPADISARAVNGVTRAWPAGTEVDVWTPAIVSL